MNQVAMSCFSTWLPEYYVPRSQLTLLSKLMRNLVGALLVLVLSAAMLATLSKLMRNLVGALLVLPAAMLATRVGRQAA